ncbi:uncharacterized protein [Oscarella lobularis]|uniref:uncharacterized protein n=1 Tax=Oscarella lobularis TaxID=121494 RepID=UPI003313FAF8
MKRFSFGVVLLLATSVQCLDNGLIRTPPMGWSTWNKFHCGINETLVKEIADVMAAKLSKFGYEYVNLDDCWLDSNRDSAGNLQGDKTTFPSGMKALGDYIHSKGLKYGLYGDPGTHTCQGRPGNEGHETRDAATFASWGCDYLKYDACYATATYQLHAYQDMRDALNKTGRPIGYSICPDASRCNDPNTVMWDASSIANVVMCRGDRLCKTDGANDIAPTWQSWTCMLDVQMQFNSMGYAGPGHFIMPDMLEVGNGMTNDEDQSHFSLWAMIAAPLIAGNDLRNMTDETLEILTNDEVIAVNQDPMGKPARRVYTNNITEVWSRQLHTGDYAVVLFNKDETVQKITLLWRYIGLPANQPAKLRDLWAHQDLGTFSGNYTSAVVPHGVKMFKAVQMRGGL